MRTRVLGALAPLLCFLFLTAAASRAETPPGPPPAQAPLPVPGFLSPYEVTRIVRAAGFDPLAPPLLEGSTYVLRATDFRGILMRVVVDGHSGAIRAVNRIVAATDDGMMRPPYGAPPYGPPPYAARVYGGPPYAALPAEEGTGYDGAEIVPAEPGAPPAAVPPPPAHAASRPGLPTLPPLPRPRPASLVSRKLPDDAASGIKSGDKSGPTSAATPSVRSDGKSDAAAASAAPSASAKPAPPPIND